MPRILSLDEFEAAFPDEDACWNHLARARWPNGFRCPLCDQTEHRFLRSRRLFECLACGHQSSVTSGTLLQDTKLALRTWMRAVYLFATTKKSVSACELQRKLGLGSYSTAWLLHAKIQRALKKDAQDLRGLVEVDETFVGPVSLGRGGRGSGKAVVAVAVEERGEHAGRLALLHVQDASSGSLAAFVQANVELGSVIKTDGWKGYARLPESGYQHAAEVEGAPERAPEVLPRMHVAAGNLKRVLDGVHAGRVSRRHLHAYLAEFAFRYNHRGHVGRAFGIALQLIAQARPLTYKMVVP